MAITSSKRKRREKRKFTYEDYLKLPDDSKRYEVLNGELIMAPAPTTAHQRLSLNLSVELVLFLKKEKLGELFYAPFDVVLDDNNIVQPDIVFVTNEKKDIVTDNNIKGTPDLLIEILSPSTGYYDLVEKKEIYEKFGVKEYWIIDPQKKWIEIYSLKQNKYSLLIRIEKKGKIKSSLLTKLDLDIYKIFEGITAD